MIPEIYMWFFPRRHTKAMSVYGVIMLWRKPMVLSAAGIWDPSRWWRHSLDEQSRSQSSMDDGSGSGSDTPEAGYPGSIPGTASAPFCLLFHAVTCTWTSCAANP